jgi:hypothetical protein
LLAEQEVKFQILNNKKKAQKITLPFNLHIHATTRHFATVEGCSAGSQTNDGEIDGGCEHDSPAFDAIE